MRDLLEWVDAQPFWLLVVIFFAWIFVRAHVIYGCLLYTSPSPRD